MGRARARHEETEESHKREGCAAQACTRYRKRETHQPAAKHLEARAWSQTETIQVRY